MTCKDTRAALLSHVESYPSLEIQDIFKFIFQSALGCEHMVSDRERVLSYIRYELSAMPKGEPKIEPLDGDYSRVHLSCVGEGITDEQLADIFLMSSRREPNGKENIEKKLLVAREMIESGEMRFSVSDFDAAVNEWRTLGYPAIHHSVAFREAYHPAYRVIHNSLLGGILNGL